MEINPRQRNAEIDAYLREEKQKLASARSDPRILILGTSDSGKSTLVKQMKILFSGGFTPEEVFILMN